MPSKTVNLAAALLATSALVTVAADLGAQWVGRAAVDRFVAAHPGLSVASVEASPSRGRLVLEGVRFGTPTHGVSIGTLTLPMSRPGFDILSPAEASPLDDDSTAPAGGPTAGPQAPANPPHPAAEAAPQAQPSAPAPAAQSAPPAKANLGTASAENVVITSGTMTYTIKRIDVAGTPLSNADLAAIFDQKSPATIADRLRKVTATAIVIPEVKGDDVAQDHELHWSERQILLANVVAGRVGVGSAAGASIASKDAKSVVDGTIGAIEASGIDLPRLVRVITTKRTDDSEPLVPLMDSVVVNGAVFNDVTDDAKTTFGTIKETGFKGRPLAVDPTTAGKDTATSKAVMTDLVQSFALGGFEADGFVFDGGPSKDKVSLERVSLRDFASGRIGDLAVGRFLFEDEGSKVGIGSFDISSFALPIAPGATGSNATASLLPLSSKTEIEDVVVDTKMPSNTANDPAARLQFTLKSFGLAGEAAADGTPKSGSMTFAGFAMPIAPRSAMGPLAEMGYSQLDLSGGMNVLYDAKALTMRISDLSLDGAGMGAVTLGFDFANAGPALFSTDTDAAKVAALAMLVKRLDIKVRNAGLVEKVLAWRAAADGLTPTQERDQAIDFVAVKLPTSLGNGPKLQAIGTTIGKFLADPRTLHIDLRSTTGIGGADMALIGTPDTLIESLDVEATADGK